MDCYREEILDHYKHPRNFGHLNHPDKIGEENNVSCGDKIVIEITIKNNGVDDIRFSGEGCAISQASASMLTEKVKGKSVQYIFALKTKDIEKMLGTTLTPSRIKCAILSLEVLQKTIAYG